MNNPRVVLFCRDQMLELSIKLHHSWMETQSECDGSLFVVAMAAQCLPCMEMLIKSHILGGKLFPEWTSGFDMLHDSGLFVLLVLISFKSNLFINQAAL